jgi:hypothetical protein
MSFINIAILGIKISIPVKFDNSINKFKLIYINPTPVIIFCLTITDNQQNIKIPSLFLIIKDNLPATELQLIILGDWWN